MRSKVLIFTFVEDTHCIVLYYISSKCLSVYFIKKRTAQSYCLPPRPPLVCTSLSATGFVWGNDVIPRAHQLHTTTVTDFVLNTLFLSS